MGELFYHDRFPRRVDNPDAAHRSQSERGERGRAWRWYFVPSLRSSAPVVPMPPAPPEMCTPAPPEMCTPPHSPMPASPLPSPPADEEELPEAMDVDEELLPVYPSLHRTRGGLRVHLPYGSMVAWSTFRQRPGEWADICPILVELLELAGENPAKKRRIDFNDGASTGARCCLVAAGGRGHLPWLG